MVVAVDVELEQRIAELVAARWRNLFDRTTSTLYESTTTVTRPADGYAVLRVLRPRETGASCSFLGREVGACLIA